MKGIDVSTSQGIIDWDKVKANNIEFAMIKATQGKSVTGRYSMFADSKFSRNITYATKVGIPCGVYHYLTAKTIEETIEEAKLFTDTIKAYKARIKLWAAVDVEEDKYLPKDKTLLTTLVRTFCDYVKARGYKPMIYTNRNYMRYRLDMSKLSDIDMWQAHWSSFKPNDCGERLKIWQYGASRVGGINGNVDSNYGYFEIDKIQAPLEKPAEAFRQGERVRVINTTTINNRRVAKLYGGGTWVVWKDEYNIHSVTGNRAVLSSSGVVIAAVNINDIERI